MVKELTIIVVAMQFKNKHLNEKDHAKQLQMQNQAIELNLLSISKSQDRVEKTHVCSKVWTERNLKTCTVMSRSQFVA